MGEAREICQDRSVSHLLFLPTPQGIRCDVYACVYSKTQKNNLIKISHTYVSSKRREWWIDCFFPMTQNDTFQIFSIAYHKSIETIGEIINTLFFINDWISFKLHCIMLWKYKHNIKHDIIELVLQFEASIPSLAKLNSNPSICNGFDFHINKHFAV